MFKKAILAASLLSVASCASIPQEAGLTLNPVFTNEDIGNKKAVSLSVQDERVSNVIGYRGSGIMQTGEVTLRNIETSIEDQIKKGFLSKGFVVNPTNKDIPSVNVKILNISYKLIPGIVSGTTKVEAALKIVAKSHNGTYTKVYRGENQSDVFFVNTSDENQEQINNAVDTVLVKMMNDNELLQHLKQ